MGASMKVTGSIVLSLALLFSFGFLSCNSSNEEKAAIDITESIIEPKEAQIDNLQIYILTFYRNDAKIRLLLKTRPTMVRIFSSQFP